MENFTEEEKKGYYDWINTRPPLIQEAIKLAPPINLYKLKDTGKQCVILCYDEPESGILEDVTVTVKKTGKGGVFEDSPFEILDTNQVFGVSISDLEIIETNTI